MPEVEYQRHNRAKYLIIYHLIFVVKYRRPLVIPYGQRMKEILHQIAAGSDFAIQEMEVDRDQVHLMIQSQPKLAPAQIVRRLKAESTRLIWQEHPELKRQFWKKQVFWSDGYFCVCIGNASIETVKHYIESQG
jgi:putative transposase